MNVIHPFFLTCGKYVKAIFKHGETEYSVAGKIIGYSKWDGAGTEWTNANRKKIGRTLGEKSSCTFSAEYEGKEITYSAESEWRAPKLKAKYYYGGRLFAKASSIWEHGEEVIKCRLIKS